MSIATSDVTKSGPVTPRAWRVWAARLAVAAVFVVNVWCALAFILDPESYVAGFELVGVPGRIAVQSFGILFLMWNATYPPVIWDPVRHRLLFVVVLVQQTIGVVGETVLWATLPTGYERLLATGLRFLRFDAAALAVMAVGFALTSGSRYRLRSQGTTSGGVRRRVRWIDSA